MPSVIIKPVKYLLALFIFVLATFPAYRAILHSGMMTSHDGEGHIIRMYEFNQAIGDGNFPVRWSKRLNWGLGYPFFNFNYPLIYYTTYILNILGFGLLNSFKIILLVSFPLGGWFCFIWLKQKFGFFPSIVGGFFYILVPYHFLNVYVRGNIGETYALTIVPLAFYFLEKLHQKINLKNSIFLAFILTLIILIHNITALIFLPIIFCYGLILNLKKQNNFFRFVAGSFLLSLILTCFFWLPAFTDKQFIIIDKVFPKYFEKNFPSFKDLIYSPWGFGGSQTGPGQMSVQIGIFQLMTLIISPFLLLFTLKKDSKQTKNLSAFFVVLSFISLFFMQKISIFFWQVLHPIQYLQFPWRLLSVLVLTSCFFAAELIEYFFSKKKFAGIFLGLLLVVGLFYANRNHWKANEYYSLPDYWFNDSPYSSTTTVDGEHTPIWQTENMPLSTARFEILSGDPKIKDFVWKTNYHSFSLSGEEKSVILDRTVYFPGWIVFVDQKQIKLMDPYDPKSKGLIGFEVPKGNHQVEIILKETIKNKIADGISLLGLILTLVFLLRNSLRLGRTTF